MTRAQEIESLRARIVSAERARKLKTVSILYARLHSLILRQLRAEMKAEKAA